MYTSQGIQVTQMHRDFDIIQQFARNAQRFPATIFNQMKPIVQIKLYLRLILLSFGYLDPPMRIRIRYDCQ